MKPKINDKIWAIYGGQIFLETVQYLGESSFLIEGYVGMVDPEFEYEDYNKRWFKDLEKAKKEIRKKYGRNIKIEKIQSGFWEAEIDD